MKAQLIGTAMFKPTSAHEAPSLRNLTRAILVFSLLLIQGCSPGVITGLTLKDAEQYLASTGNTRPPGITIGRIYTEEEAWISWSSAWNCNHQLVRVRVSDLVLNLGQDNSFDGILSMDGDCQAPSGGKIAGRYFKDYFFYYYVNVEPRYIFRYRIGNRGAYMEYAGKLVLQDGELRIDENYLKHADSVTGDTRNGSQTDMYETYGYARKDKLPTETLAERKRELAVSKGAEASTSANEYSRQNADQARRNRENAEESRAKGIAALNQLGSDYEKELRRRRTSPSSVPTTPATTNSSRTSSEKPPPTALTPHRPSVEQAEPPRSTPMWTYIGKTAFEGVGPTQADGCDSAEKRVAEFSPTMADTKRKLISRQGGCTCSGIPGNPIAKPAYVCRIAYSMEITTPRNPNVNQTTSEGVSR